MKLLFGLVVAFVGCRHRPAPGESIAEVCRLENDGKELAASGYLLPPMVFASCETACGLALTASSRERYGITIDVPIGTGPNSMSPLPSRDPLGPEWEQIPSSAFVVRDQRGKELRLGEPARVHGTLRVVESGDQVLCTFTRPSIAAR
jgi:hypothetical protein